MKVIIFTKGDCANIGFSYLYEYLISNNIGVDLCAKDEVQSLCRYFKNCNIINISKDGFPVLDNYDAIIVPRTPFYLEGYEKYFINYKGVIIADNTTPYEGHDVFGDVVLECGKMNYINSYNFLPLSHILCGSIKNDVIVKRKHNTKNILFIESGHFPFGKKGREELADLIINLAETYPDYQVIIKPRYLRNQKQNTDHFNSDHIYNYIESMKNERILPNLILLEEYIELEKLIEEAHIVLHTYSSAFSEAISQRIKTINVYDITSEEVFEFRKNRFKKIKDYIDKANLNISKDEVVEKLLNVEYCDKEYVSQLIYDKYETSYIIKESILRLCEYKKRNKELRKGELLEFDQLIDFNLQERMTLNKLKEFRLKGCILNKIYRYEYLFDDFEVFNRLKIEILNDVEKIERNSLNELDSYIYKKVKNIVLSKLKFTNSLEISSLLNFFLMNNDLKNVIDYIYLAKNNRQIYCYFMGLVMKKLNFKMASQILLNYAEEIKTKKKYKEICID